MDNVRIVELTKGDSSLPKLNSQYFTKNYYDLSIIHEPEAWKMELTLETLEKPLRKSYVGTFFEKHIEEPRVFAAVLMGIRLAGLNSDMRSGTTECVFGSF